MAPVGQISWNDSILMVQCSFRIQRLKTLHRSLTLTAGSGFKTGGSLCRCFFFLWKRRHLQVPSMSNFKDASCFTPGSDKKPHQDDYGYGLHDIVFFLERDLRVMAGQPTLP